MRLAVVDVGNTSTAAALWVDGRVSKVVHIDGGGEAALNAVKSIIARGVDAIAYVSVVPEADARWCQFASDNNIEFRQVTWRKALSCFKIDYPKPDTIGADRLADAAGALARHGAPVVVMDFGTAFTAAAITSDCIWRGGVIAPGFPLMRDYLFERTAKLPYIKLSGARIPKIGRSTEQAMRFGAFVGYRGMVREIVNELKKNFQEDFKIVATGGFAKRVLCGLDMPFIIDQTLTLYGAGLICSKQ